MFEKLIRESFNSHLKIAKKIIKEKKEKKEKFIKFGFFDFDETLYSREGKFVMEGYEPYNALVECMKDPEPCYVSIVTARGSDSKEFINNTLKENLEDLFQSFTGKFTIETVRDLSPESKPSIYEIANLKASVINSIIQNNTKDLQETLVIFYDDVEENVREVANTLDSLSIPTKNCFVVDQKY